MPQRPGNLIEITVAALTDSGQPMNCQQIIRWARERGQLRVQGKTPEKSLHAALTRWMAREATLIRKAGPGKFALKKRLGK